MSRRRRWLEHATIFVAALLTLPAAAVVGEAIGPLFGGAVIVAGAGLALASTRRLDRPSALVPTVAAMLVLFLAMAGAALSDPSDGCRDGTSGWMDGCVRAESVIVDGGIALIVLTVVLCFLQLMVAPTTDAVRDRLPPSARRPMDDAWVTSRVDRERARGPHDAGEQAGCLAGAIAGPEQPMTTAEVEPRAGRDAERDQVEAAEELGGANRRPGERRAASGSDSVNSVRRRYPT